MILAEVTTGDWQAFIGSIGIFVITLIVKDYLRDRMSKPKEQSKIDNLSAQTILLTEHKSLLEDMLRTSKKSNKKFKKTLERIDENTQILRQRSDSRTKRV